EYDPALVSCDIDPVDLSERFASLGKQRVSLCLSGPPGTGKSAFVRHLAERAGLEVAHKRASDLLSMWVGGTEAAIAGAFAEAREGRLFLVFDEAESLLADRRGAGHSWELSQVNEMLTWMESHPLPFACTTNYAERLDPATLRRFDFKVALDYLSREQASAAFRLFFKLDPPPGLSELSGVTPGDFTLVRRQAKLLGRLGDAQALVSMLYRECALKPDRPAPIGFCP
ncbi:MAG: AAA family ATPase, partial [Proteobacteria bacterium]|nr:AAA family ATPase [Pseudomonadota bacterium]MYJ95279.1 AAA family ATPase [Pseudomonadota bacterium]